QLASRRCRAEESEQRAVGLEQAGQLDRERLRRRRVQVIDQIPREDAVDAACGLHEAFGEKRRKVSRRASTDVPLEVGVQILDEYLAAQRLAEKGQVRPDDGTQVEQHRRVQRGERPEELLQRLGRL